MATLNVKNFPDQLYERLKAIAEAERRSVASQVTHLLEQATATSEELSILELRGLGKDYWSDLDAADHVRRERDAWT